MQITKMLLLPRIMTLVCSIVPINSVRIDFLQLGFRALVEENVKLNVKNLADALVCYIICFNDPFLIVLSEPLSL